MLQMGQCIYRFKFEFSQDGVDIIKHIFKVVQIEPAERPPVVNGRAIDRYKFECVNYPKATYKDGRLTWFDEGSFGEVISCGGFIFVLLSEDNKDEAILLVQRYLDDLVESCRDSLSKAESRQLALDDYRRLYS